MTPDGSVTHWLQLLQAGENSAARDIWERYFHRLVGLARTKLQMRGGARRARDEEDVALSVFDTFCRGLEEGRFRKLEGRDNLWKLLVVITGRKALRQVKHECRLKRGGGKVRVEADLTPAAAQEGAGGEAAAEDAAALEQIIGREPSPEFAAQVAEECGLLLERLGDDGLRSIACWKMEGDTNAEIAARLGCQERTVERKLRVIRGLWENEA